MAEEEKQTERSETPNEEISRILIERAEKITSVRNDVYTTKWWQLVINFILGAGALVLLILSMVYNGKLMAAFAFSGVGVGIALLLFNYILRSMSPTSFLQYTCIDRGRRFCFLILSKTRASFTDGTDTIECNRDVAARLDAPLYTQYRFDFFKDMDVSTRIVEGEKETYIGTIEDGGKTYKCKIVFLKGMPVYGTVGGARIKYFDINHTKDKFVVPYALKAAAKALNIVFPKLPGIYVRDDVKDLTKQ